MQPQKSGAKIQAKMGLVLVEIIYYTEKKTNFAVSNIAGQMSPIQLPTHTDGLTSLLSRLVRGYKVIP